MKREERLRRKFSPTIISYFAFSNVELFVRIIKRRINILMI